MLRALFAAVLSGSASALAAQEAPAPAERPPLSAFVDSAALVRAVAGLSVPELPPGIPPLFIVSFDSTGEATVRARFDEIPEGYALPVVEAIRAHLVPRTGGWSYLRVVAGAEPRVERPATILSTPPGVSDRGFERELERLARAFAERSDVPQGSYRSGLRLEVRADGTPDLETVRLTRSTGYPELDAEILAIVERLRFQPATVEGIPVRAQVHQPLQIEIPDPPRSPRERGRG